MKIKIEKTRKKEKQKKKTHIFIVQSWNLRMLPFSKYPDNSYQKRQTP